MLTTTTPPALLPAQDPLLARATPRQRAAARDFEAQALNALLAPAFATVDLGRSPFGGGAGESQWQPMLLEQMTKSIARAGGLGLAAPVLREMVRMQANREGENTP